MSSQFARSIAAVAALSVGVISGCGSDDDSGGSSADAAGKKSVSITYVLPSLDNEAYKAGVDAIKKSADEDGKIDLEVLAGAANDDAAQQVTNIKTALAKGTDALIVLPTDPKVLSKPLQQVTGDVPIVAIGAEIPDYTPDGLVLFPDRAGGELAGKFLADNVANGSQIGILHCQPGNPVLDDRVAGAKSQWTDKNFEVVATLDAQCDNAKGRAVMADMLTANPGIDAVFSVSDSQTIGALAAAKAAGKKPFFVSYDAQSAALKKIAQGELDGTVDINIPTGASDALAAATSLARGQELKSKVVDVKATMATPDNVGEILAER